ncbi:MAG: transglutaminase family protein [Pseudomonadota bacterium]
MKVALTHITRYHYDRPVDLGPQVVRLRPAPHCRTKILSYALKVTPQEHFLNWQQDAYANFLGRIVVPEPTRQFEVAVDLIADLEVINPFDFFLESHAETFPFGYDAETKKELEAYLEIEESGPLLESFLEQVDLTERLTNDFLVELNQLVEKKIDYVIRMEPGVQTCEETLKKGRGSCRDSSWLLVQVLRNLGLAARFASGYLIQLVPDKKALDGPQGTDKDFTDLHAWAEVYLPGAGWVGMDPTSGLFTGEGHIPLACAPKPTGAAPISGLASDAEVEFSFEMNVTRLDDGPRITKPFPEEMWDEIDALGTQVDAALEDGDVRLTMGGEPTFVAIDNVDHDEWNTEAVGPTKRAYSDTLIRRLRETFAPGGMLHYGQGKWYPGESLPRWAFALYWREDGEPLWRNVDLVAKEAGPSNATDEDVAKFTQTLAQNLGLSAKFAQPVYEDPVPYTGKEARLPNNVTIDDSKLSDPEERARLIRVFEHGLGKPTGYVLPVQRQQDADRGGWRSEMWKSRRNKLYLLPGDSPVGFRLPIESLPWVPKAAYPYFFPADPFAPKQALKKQRQNEDDKERDAEKRQDTHEQVLFVGEPVRTALSVEVRGGHMCVFLPPTERANDYVDLIQAVEESAEELGQPIHIEGYMPPSDSRLNVMKVTPDPGVIEVNIHPARSWDEIKHITTSLYEDARLSRLTAEKFMIDGRHTGTGGGNHVVMGAEKPEDSPFLRRPDLLRSMLTFWQQHPSLSYLFSGLFIGPTSQAPRIDEARTDSLYELEIAFKEIDRLANQDGIVQPWSVDRLLRNLLIDSTGNTHRTEICIDKLYSPDGPTGRLGLLEFRGFEMPPHPKMSLVQQLLLRALVARFWKNPYRGKLIDWGMALHDKFMLPHFIWQDFCCVLEDLRGHGFDFDETWFEAFYDFRFPLYGRTQQAGMTVSLRQALEPWHVLGEEGAVGGTARYVDSSLERMQVDVEHFDPERYVIGCNGYEVPLTQTQTPGSYVAGVRFKAWQPARSLQPTLPIHAPLRFDIYDKIHSRSIGGCTYHVAHPGGRSHEALPVNSNEAEGRRLARFISGGHSIGDTPAPRSLKQTRFPYCLDLRWC